MNRSTSITITVFIAFFLILFWRISANESALEKAIISLDRSGNKGEISEVTISLLAGNTLFSGLKIPIDSASSIKTPRLEISIGRINMLRLALFNPKSVLQSGEEISGILKNPVYESANINYQFAESVSYTLVGDVSDAIISFLSKKPMSHDWRFQAELVGVTAWKNQPNSQNRPLAVPFFDRVDVTLLYQNGLKVLTTEISAISATENQALITGQAFYDGLSPITKPYKTALKIDYNGELPVNLPIFGLEKSTINSQFLKINGTLDVRNPEISQADIKFQARGLHWTPPTKWPKPLAPAYLVFGSNPKSISIDSLRFKLNISNELLHLDNLQLFGSVMTISSDIFAPKIDNSDAYLLEAASVEIFFRTPESAQLAQMLLKYSGQDKLRLQSNRLNIRFRGTTKNPALTSF